MVMDPVLAFRAEDRIAANPFKAKAKGYLPVLFRGLCSLLEIITFVLEIITFVSEIITSDAELV